MQEVTLNGIGSIHDVNGCFSGHFLDRFFFNILTTFGPVSNASAGYNVGACLILKIESRFVFFVRHIRP